MTSKNIVNAFYFLQQMQRYELIIGLQFISQFPQTPNIKKWIFALVFKLRSFYFTNILNSSNITSELMMLCWYNYPWTNPLECK